MCGNHLITEVWMILAIPRPLAIRHLFIDSSEFYLWKEIGLYRFSLSTAQIIESLNTKRCCSTFPREGAVCLWQCHLQLLTFLKQKVLEENLHWYMKTLTALNIRSAIIALLIFNPVCRQMFQNVVEIKGSVVGVQIARCTFRGKLRPILDCFYPFRLSHSAIIVPSACLLFALTAFHSSVMLLFCNLKDKGIIKLKGKWCRYIKPVHNWNFLIPIPSCDMILSQYMSHYTILLQYVYFLLYLIAKNYITIFFQLYSPTPKSKTFQSMIHLFHRLK